MYGIFSIEYDRMGFPLVQIGGHRFLISLFPVSKWQFERFMADCGPRGGFYTDAWYRGLLALNPRRAWRDCNANPWEHFLTGLRYEEIAPFLRYLGAEFRLPSVEEWKAYLCFADELESAARHTPETLAPDAPAPVQRWIHAGLCPLMKEGLLEMAVDGNTRRYIGKPDVRWHGNTWKPDGVRDVNWEACRKLIGFRVVKNAD